jgi:hypothetical protein
MLGKLGNEPLYNAMPKTTKKKMVIKKRTLPVHFTLLQRVGLSVWKICVVLSGIVVTEIVFAYMLKR